MVLKAMEKLLQDEDDLPMEGHLPMEYNVCLTLF